MFDQNDILRKYQFDDYVVNSLSDWILYSNDSKYFAPIFLTHKKTNESIRANLYISMTNKDITEAFCVYNGKIIGNMLS